MNMQVPRSNWGNRMVKMLASSRPGSWFLSHSLHHLDRTVINLTHNQTSLTTILAGLPVLTLTTRGAKSGKPRAVPLIGVPMGNEVVLIASNWGRAFHPAWYRNLKAHPAVTLAYQGKAAEYSAKEAEGDLRAELWGRAVEIYPGYDAYKRRAGKRQIPVVVLTPKVGSS
jgi:deazaflavin-dependent oxidoreductase (nitroreductase family)